MGRADVRDYRDSGIEMVPPMGYWETAAVVKASGGIALGDAFAVALAARSDATLVVGAGGDFDDIPVDVEIERFRTTPG